MALRFWIFGSFAFFIVVVLWSALTPAIDIVYDVMNSSAANLSQNATEIMDILSFVHSGWSYAIIALIIAIVVVIYLASIAREPQSDIRRGGF